MKILIAEDDPVSRKLLARIIEKWGHEVLAAEDGHSAWSIFQNSDIQLVITDWMMPKVDGIELCRRIRSAESKEYVYVIILTAREKMMDVIEGFEAGADDFVTKPFNQEELKSRIQVGIRILALENNLYKKNSQLKEVNDKLTGDMRAAAKVQRSLLPNQDLKIAGVNVFWEFNPCDQLGGDILNVFRLDESRYGVYLLDVSGHGVPAALHAVALSRILSENQGIVKNIVPDHPFYAVTPPDQVLAKLNKQFPMDIDNGQYFTILYGILNMCDHTFRWSSAGHPFPIIVDENKVVFLDNVGGPPIGFFEDAEYQKGFYRLKSKQKILIYSDGIPEAMNDSNQPFSMEGIKKTVENNRNLGVREVIGKVNQGVREWTSKKGGPGDDVSIIGLEILEF